MVDSHFKHVIICAENKQFANQLGEMLIHENSSAFRCTVTNQKEQLDQLILQLQPQCVVFHLKSNEPYDLIQIKKIKDTFTDILLPLIVIVDQGQELQAIKALEYGAEAYILAENCSAKVLNRTLLSAWQKIDIVGLENKQQKMLFKLSNTDSLTGLANRLVYEQYLSYSIARSLRFKRQMAVMHLVIDDFHDISKQYGERLCDDLLVAVGLRIQSYLRHGDLVARYSNSNFAIILDEINEFYDASVIAKRLINVLNMPFSLQNTNIKISCSIGIACFPIAGDTVLQLNTNAFKASQLAIENGGNCYHFFSEALNQESQQILMIANALHNALENNQFYLCFQPIYNLLSKQVVALEALIRWEHPSIGIIYPNEFIHLAEKSGLIIDIGHWVLQASCQQLADFRTKGLNINKVFVNVSARQLENSSLIYSVDSALETSKLTPENLGIEITETALMKNVNQSFEMLSQLRAKGIQIAIDDFGTGFFSLSFIKQLPFDTLKIDRSFVNGLNSDNTDKAIVQAVLNLVHNLNLNVVAEGIETPEQLQYLLQHHCAEGQGFLFSRPLSGTQLESYLRKSYR